MCLGAGLGLAATAPLFLFLPALVAATAFAFVLAFGLLELRRKSGRWSPATVGLWFAFLGGMSSVGMTWFAGSSSSFSAIAVTSGTIGVFGMTACLIGAGIGGGPDSQLSQSTVIDRNWIGALLVCVGGAFGLAGSRATFFFLFVLLSTTCFSLVLLFGVRMFRKGPESRLLSAATLYFALVGLADLVFVLPALILFASASLWLDFRLVGTVIAVSGAIIQLRRPTR
jgi:hypothetical protein